MLNRIISLPEKQSFFLFGPRQTGKSTLIHSILNERSWTVDLLQSDLFLRYARAPETFRAEAEQKIRNEGVASILVDEVQRLPDILNEVHWLLEHYQCRFILTGSSVRKLVRGGSNLLGGRAAVRHLFPFVYQELGDRFDLNEALRYGTLPPTIDCPVEEKIDILIAYANTYLREEIQQEGLVRNLGGFSRLLDLVASRCGELVSFSAFGRECGLPTRTVQSYFEILEDTLVGFRLEPWMKSARRRLVAHPKFYLFDIGVTNAINRRLRADPDPVVRGRLFEQLVVLEVRRMMSYIGSEARVFFWRTNTGAEVDLLIEKHGSLRAAIEIKASANVSGNDFSGLRSFSDAHPGVPRYVVCTAPEPFERDGVSVLPWRRFFERISEVMG